MGSDILADGCNAQKPVGSTEKLASLHVNNGDEIFALLEIYAARILVRYRRFGTTYRSHLPGSSNLQ